MTFVLEHEEQATLAEALAFIDAFPLESAATESSSSKKSSAEHDHVLTARARNTRAVNQYRKRNKSDILRLRDELRLLDARLTQLRANATSSASGALSRSLRLQPSAVSIDAAVAELRQLEKSEALNRRLKAALNKQRTVSATLESQFRKEISKNVRVSVSWMRLEKCILLQSSTVLALSDVVVD